LQLYEMVITFILIAPLVIAIIVLSANLLGAGIKDIVTFLNNIQNKEKELATEPYPESDVISYIKDLKEEKELRQ
jgi:hypothetical protein